MVVYVLYIYNRHCECIYERDYRRGNIAGKAASDEDARRGAEEEQRLLYGMLFSMRQFVLRMSPPVAELTADATTTAAAGTTQGQPQSAYAFDSGIPQLHCYTTASYRLHSFQAPTGYTFVAITDPNTPSLHGKLRALFIPFVDLVVKNPFCDPDAGPFTAPAFDAAVKNFVESR